MDPLLTAPEVAKLLKITVRTLENMVARNAAPPMLRVGRQRRWRKVDIEEWLATQITSHPSKSNIREGA